MTTIEPKAENQEIWADLAPIFSDEHVRKAFALLLSSVDVDDVFCEFIVPAAPISSQTKERG